MQSCTGNGTQLPNEMSGSRDPKLSPSGRGVAYEAAPAGSAGVRASCSFAVSSSDSEVLMTVPW